MSRRDRAARWIESYETLPPFQRGLAMLVIWADLLSLSLLWAVLAVATALAARRSWRARQLGPAAAARAAVTPGLLCAVTAYAAHRVLTAVGMRAVDHGRGRIWLEHAEQWFRDRSDAGPD